MLQQAVTNVLETNVKVGSICEEVGYKEETYGNSKTEN